MYLSSGWAGTVIRRCSEYDVGPITYETEPNHGWSRAT